MNQPRVLVSGAELIVSGAELIPRPQQPNTKPHSADNVQRHAHTISRDIVQRTTTLFLAVHPLPDHALRLRDGLREDKRVVRLVEPGRRGLAVHAPLRALGGDDVAAVDVKDLIVLDGFGEAGLARSYLVDDTGIGGPHHVGDGRDGDEGVRAQLTMGIVQFIPRPVWGKESTPGVSYRGSLS